MNDLSQNPNFSRCSSCQSLSDVYCKQPQCYPCFKSHILRTFKQTLRLKIISKINYFIQGMTKCISETGDQSPKFGNGISRNQFKVGLICSDSKYGLDVGLYSVNLLLYLLLVRNAHRRKLYLDLTLDKMPEMLQADDIEITCLYILRDLDDDCRNMEGDLFMGILPIKYIYIENSQLLNQIDSESPDAGLYCRNLAAIHSLKDISADVIMLATSIEQSAFSCLFHSMLGLGGEEIIRDPYIQPVYKMSSLYDKKCARFIARPLRDLTAKEIYLLSRYLKLPDTGLLNCQIKSLPLMDFLLNTSAKHTNSLINITKITADSFNNFGNSNVCSFCKFANNNDKDICHACQEVVNLSKHAKLLFDSLI